MYHSLIIIKTDKVSGYKFVGICMRDIYLIETWITFAPEQI